MIKQNVIAHKLSLIIIFFFLFGGCEIPPTGDSGTNSTPTLPQLSPERTGEIVEEAVQAFNQASAELEELSRPNHVQAWVDNLIVKRQPGTDMPELTRMKEGEVATYLHQRTMGRTAFTLRGQRYEDPWILIKTKAGSIGWVHEGGVRYVTPNFLKWLNQRSAPNARVRGAELPDSPLADRLVVLGQRVGPIRQQTPEKDLIQLYGAANVTQGKVSAPGKGLVDCTIIFPKSNDELRITWKDQARTRISAVYILRSGSTWFTSHGLRFGVNLHELTKINQAPLRFYGLNWTYAGTVNDWTNGRLAPLARKFYVMLSPRGAPEELQRKFRGDALYSSNADNVDALNLFVSQWVIYLD